MIRFRGKKYREKLEKKTFMLKNGEILLEKFITTFDGKRNPIRNFSSEELKLATNNYDKMNVMRGDGDYTFYKGFLNDRQISVMKYSFDYNFLYEERIKNIVFTSQMCHKHILKLIGCCLDTRTPILVFESMVKCGTLEDHIYRPPQPRFESLTWRQRLKITMEIANAFAYLHVGFTRPIVYAGMSLSKVLLDDHYVPKLFDFTLAECIPEGETEIVMEGARGKIGYLAPEQISKGILHEKCDVYGFGVLLVEVLVGQRNYEFFKSIETNDEFGENNSEIEHNKDWCSDVLTKTVRSNRFIELIDPIIAGDGLCPETEQQVIVFAELSCKCLSLSAEDRPTMIEVAKQLRQLYLSA